MKNVGTKTIETDRLILRQFKSDDIPCMFKNWVNDAEVPKFLSWEPHGNIKVTCSIVTEWIIEYENNETYNWAIVNKENDEAIGSITVISMSQKHKSCELGYCLSRNFWSKGIMTEATRAIISFLFEEVGLRRIQAQHDVMNLASEKVLLKSGMMLEGVLRQRRVRKDGSIADGKIWSILHDDWSRHKL